MNMRIMSEWMVSSPHNFPLILFTEMTKSHISAIWERKTLNKCKIMFALIYFDMGTYIHVWAKKDEHFQNCIYKTHGKFWGDEATHSFAYSYRLFKKCFVENYENSNFHIFLILFIYSQISMFCANFFTLSLIWTNLNLDRSSPLIR